MLNGFIPLIRSNRTNRNARTILYHLKRFRRTNAVRKPFCSTKTFNRYHLPLEANSVPLKTFNWYQMPNQSYFVPHKTFSRDKTRTNCRPHLQTHQDNHTGNRHPSTTTSLTSATRPCTLIRQTKRQRNGSTDMDTVPRKIGIQRIIRVDSPDYP